MEALSLLAKNNHFLLQPDMIQGLVAKGFTNHLIQSSKGMCSVVYGIFSSPKPKANFSQSWHKASLVEGGSSLFKWRALPYSKGR